jgi:hypothetical protein
LHVEAIRNYLKSDKSSYERGSGGGVKMIWNGATKADRYIADLAGESEKPLKICYGLESRKYGT